VRRCAVDCSDCCADGRVSQIEESFNTARSIRHGAAGSPGDCKCCGPHHRGQRHSAACPPFLDCRWCGLPMCMAGPAGGPCHLHPARYAFQPNPVRIPAGSAVRRGEHPAACDPSLAGHLSAPVHWHSRFVARRHIFHGSRAEHYSMESAPRTTKLCSPSWWFIAPHIIEGLEFGGSWSVNCTTLPITFRRQPNCMTSMRCAGPPGS
jgi:hypothetical protein